MQTRRYHLPGLMMADRPISHEIKSLGSVVRISGGWVATLGIWLVAGASIWAADTPADAPSGQFSKERRTQLYARADQTFQGGHLLKPRVAEATDIQRDRAPLLLLEGTAAPDAGTPAWEFGLLRRKAHGTPRLEPGTPAVYVVSSDTILQGDLLPQSAYFWFYRRHGVPADAAWRIQGVRVTYSKENEPLIWEVLKDTSGLSPVYVVETLEAKASGEYGGPFPERRYAVEPLLEHRPDIIVPRLVGKSDLPLGPWLYLKRRTMDAAVVLCRCMPSQVEPPLETDDYQLRAWPEGLLNATSCESPSWLSALSNSLVASPGYLDELLRLPIDSIGNP